MNDFVFWKPYPSIVSACSSGLANRIHVMVGCWRMARRVNRKLVVHWPYNDGIALAMSDVIEPNDAEWIEMNDEFIQFKILRTDTQVKVYNCYPESSEVKPDDQHEVIIVKSWFFPCFADESIHDFSHEYNRLIRSIKPKQKWVDLAHSIDLPSNTYGCHIRIGDRVGNQLCCTPLYAPSSVEAFERDIAFILNEEPDAHFYVSTEFIEVWNRLREKFRDKIVPWPAKVWKHRNTPEGSGDGVVELLILGRCHTILGSTMSQYSFLASGWAQVPWVEIREDRPLQSGWRQDRYRCPWLGT